MMARNHLKRDTWADTDMMYNTGFYKDFYTTMSLEKDKDKPVFCKIKVSDPGNEDFYLSSVDATDKFSKCRFLRDSRRREDSSSVFYQRTIEKQSTGHDEVYHETDHVFCIPIPERCQPAIEQTFLERLNKHEWPMNAISDLENLFREHLYIIPKPDPHNKKEGDLRWRLSFSVIEVELARSLTEIQRRCYRVLKALIKFDVNKGLPEDTDKYPSYYLKTTMFWLIEETLKDFWTIQNLGRQWLTLLDEVIESLEKKHLSHYFVPSYNLLCDKPPSAVSCWKERLKQIRQKPLEAFGKFLSKYKIICSMEDYTMGNVLNAVLEKLDNISCPSAETADILSEIEHLQKVLKYNDDIMNIAAYLRSKVTDYFLSSYNLSDLIKFAYYIEKYNFGSVHILVEVPRGVTVNVSSSPTHLNKKINQYFIWNCYSKYCSKFELIHGLDYTPRWRYSYSYLWSSLAEVTHHIARKFRDYNPEEHLFSTRTAEQFHLIACSIDPLKDLKMGKYVKYANFLYVEKRYKASANLLISVCKKRPQAEYCYFSRLTSEVADTSIKLQMLQQEEVCYSVSSLSYHLLTLSSIKCGLLAEVCIPEGVECTFSGSNLCNNQDNRIDHEEFPSNIRVCGFKKYQLGYQYITSGQLLEAFYWFASVLDEDIVTNKITPYSLKYAAMLYITSRLISHI